MENKTISLNELSDVEVDGIDSNDYPDFCDSYVSYAVWRETGVELTDEELESIDDGEISEYVLENYGQE